MHTRSTVLHLDDPMHPDLPDPDYARTAISIDDTNLVGEYARVPGDLAYWAQQLADAEQDYQLAKGTRDVAQAQATLAAVNLKVKPAAAVDAMVTLNPTVQDAEHALVAADTRRRRVRGVVDAIRVKADMLVSMGATARAEMRHAV